MTVALFTVGILCLPILLHWRNTPAKPSGLRQRQLATIIKQQRVDR